MKTRFYYKKDKNFINGYIIYFHGIKIGYPLTKQEARKRINFLNKLFTTKFKSKEKLNEFIQSNQNK